MSVLTNDQKKNHPQTGWIYYSVPLGFFGCALAMFCLLAWVIKTFLIPGVEHAFAAIFHAMSAWFQSRGAAG